MRNTKKRPMYNEERKLAFVKETTRSETAASRALNMFERTAPYEFRWGADLSTRSDDELREMLDDVCGLRTRSRFTKMSVIRRYMRWCVANDVEDAHELAEDTGSLGETKVREMLVRNPEHLQQLLNLAFEPEGEETIDNVYRCYFWLAFGGMFEETALKLSVDNVLFEYMEARYNDEISLLYRQGIPAVRNCVKLTQFKYKNQTYTKSGYIWRDRVNGTQLLRGIKAEQTVQGLRNQIARRLRSKRSNEVDLRQLSYQRVWLSGIFYRIYEQEQAGIEPDFMSVVMMTPNGRRMLGKGYKINPVGPYANEAKNLRRDYERWKLSSIL